MPSHKVQGTCGDVMRIVLVRTCEEVFTKYPDDIRFVNCVHDELDYIVRKEVFNERTEQIRSIMELVVPGTDLPLKADFEVGYSYGMVWPFEKEGERWVPKS